MTDTQYEITGNIHLNHLPSNEKTLKSIFESISSTFAITREVGNTVDKHQHYHFHIVDSAIKDLSLRKKLLQSFPELKQKHLKNKVLNANGTAKAWEKNLSVKIVKTNSPTLPEELEYEFILCYVYKDIEILQWTPILKGITLKAATDRKERYYDLSVMKDKVTKQNKASKEKQSQSLIETVIKILNKKLETVGADGNISVRNPTYLEIGTELINYKIKQYKILNSNQIQNTIESIMLHYSETFKKAYLKNIISNIEDKIQENPF